MVCSACCACFALDVGQLNFEDGKAGLQLVTVDALRRLLRAGGLQLDFVFVSACFSRKTGEAFIEAGVPHVVCVKVNEMVRLDCNHHFLKLLKNLSVFA